MCSTKLEKCELYWLIKEYLPRQHMSTITDLSDATGFSTKVIYDMCHEPRKIKIWQLDTLNDALHFDDEDFLRIAKGQLKA